MDLLIEKGGSRTYLSRYKVITTSFEESSPSVKRNNTQIQYRNGNVDFGGWHEAKKIDYVGYYRADDLEDEEYLRERIYALLSDPDGYYITQLKNDNDNSFERPGETSGDYFDKQVNRPSHKRFYVYASSLESELVGSYGGHVLYKISATFTTMKLPYGESVPRDLDVKPNVPYYSENLALGTAKAFKMTGANYINNYDYMYSLSSTIAKGTTITVAYDITSTNSTGTCLVQFVGGSWGYISGILPLTSGTQHHSYTLVTNSDYSDRIQLRLDNSTSTVTISNFIISTTPSPWNPAPADSGYNEWYIDTYYSTDDLVIPYAGTVHCSQLEQGFIVEFTAKKSGGGVTLNLNGTKLTYSGQVYSGDVFKLSGYEYTKNDISIVKDTNKAYFKLLPGVTNKISSSIAGEIRILNFQDLYA